MGTGINDFSSKENIEHSSDSLRHTNLMQDVLSARTHLQIISLEYDFVEFNSDMNTMTYTI